MIFFWGFIKEAAYIPPVVTILDDLETRKTAKLIDASHFSSDVERIQIHLNIILALEGGWGWIEYL